MLSTDAELTIVVAPREKYSRARDVLTALVAVDTPSFHLVWVDEARAPRAYRRWLADHAPRTGFTHVALPHRAGANECRMRGLEARHAPFVLFLDNDAFLGEGALSALLACMRDTDASFVTPLILERSGAVHHAGGMTAIVDGSEGPCLVEDLPLQGKQDGVARHDLVRVPTGALEMHGVLVRTDSLAAAGGLDTELLSSLDCADLGLRLQGVGGSGWLEPRATLTYDASQPRPSDLPLYLGRWCRATVEHDMTRFATKWNLEPHDARLDAHRGFLHARCMRAIPYVRGGVRRTFGAAAAKRLERALDPVFDVLSDAHANG